MTRLLPSGSKPSVEQDAEPSVLYIDHPETKKICSTLSSETALAVFQLLNNEALTTTEVADTLDVSVQNAGYHLQNLRDVDLIQVIDTCYSEKGREMDIYAITSDPKVMILARESDGTNLRNAFGQLAGAVGLPAVIIAGLHALSDVVDGLVEA